MTITPFALKDCALAAIATGQRAQNLKEFRDTLSSVHPGSIYYHFWGRLLRPRFDDPEYNNDFAVWSSRGLHDIKLAERLSIIDPTDFPDLENLRRQLIEVIEERLDETEYFPWARADQQFQFVRSQIVVFDTHRRISEPRELAPLIPHVSVGTIFYHFIDARRRSPHGWDDFRAWLSGMRGDYSDLQGQLASVDPYFVTLMDLRSDLAKVFSSYFGDLQ